MKVKLLKKLRDKAYSHYCVVQDSNNWYQVLIRDYNASFPIIPNYRCLRGDEVEKIEWYIKRRLPNYEAHSCISMILTKLNSFVIV